MMATNETAEITHFDVRNGVLTRVLRSKQRYFLWYGVQNKKQNKRKNSCQNPCRKTRKNAVEKRCFDTGFDTGNDTNRHENSRYNDVKSAIMNDITN